MPFRSKRPSDSEPISTNHRTYASGSKRVEPSRIITSQATERQRVDLQLIGHRLKEKSLEESNAILENCRILLNHLQEQGFDSSQVESLSNRRDALAEKLPTE